MTASVVKPCLKPSGSALLLSSGHYVDVPVPSPPHIVNKYKYHYVTVHDYDARRRCLVLKGMAAPTIAGSVVCPPIASELRLPFRQVVLHLVGCEVTLLHLSSALP